MRKSTSRPAEVWNFQMIIITLLFGYFPGGILRPSFPQWGTCSLPEIHTGPKGTPSSSSGSKSAAFTKTAKTQRQYLSWTVVWYEHTVSTQILMDDQPLATYIYIYILIQESPKCIIHFHLNDITKLRLAVASCHCHAPFHIRQPQWQGASALFPPAGPCLPQVSPWFLSWG